MRHLMKFGSLFAAVCLAPHTDFGSSATQPVMPDAESALPKAVAGENIKGSAPFTPPHANMAPEGDHAGATLDNTAVGGVQQRGVNIDKFGGNKGVIEL